LSARTAENFKTVTSSPSNNVAKRAPSKGRLRKN
jgi:hypothetical protein